MLKWNQILEPKNKIPESKLLELRRLPCVFDSVADETNKTPHNGASKDELQKVTCIHGKTLTVRTARVVLGLKPWLIPVNPQPTTSVPNNDSETLSEVKTFVTSVPEVT